MPAPTAELSALVAGLEPTVATVLASARRDLHARTLAAARASSRSQGRPVAGASGRGIRTGVEAAVDEFIALVADPGRDRHATHEVFRRLGRQEFADGRPLGAVRDTLVTGGRAIWAGFVAIGDAGALTPPQLYVLAEALFTYVHDLSASAAEGYLDAQETSSIDWGVARRRLLSLLAQPEVDERALRQAAETARWQVPERLAVLSVEGIDADHITRLIGGGSVGAVVDDMTRVVIPNPSAPGRLEHVRRVMQGRRSALGCTVPLGRSRASFRQSTRALRMAQQDGSVDRQLFVCAEHLVPLVLGWEPGLVDELADEVLAPLDELRQPYAQTLAETLLAWLRAHGRVNQAATVLHAHPQTVRYRMRRIQSLFGDALDDPDERYRLETALRYRLQVAATAPSSLSPS